MLQWWKQFKEDADRVYMKTTVGHAQVTNEALMGALDNLGYPYVLKRGAMATVASPEDHRVSISNFDGDIVVERDGKCYLLDAKPSGFWLQEDLVNYIASIRAMVTWDKVSALPEGWSFTYER